MEKILRLGCICIHNGATQVTTTDNGNSTLPNTICAHCRERELRRSFNVLWLTCGTSSVSLRSHLCRFGLAIGCSSRLETAAGVLAENGIKIRLVGL